MTMIQKRLVPKGVQEIIVEKTLKALKNGGIDEMGMEGLYLLVQNRNDNGIYLNIEDLKNTLKRMNKKIGYYKKCGTTIYRLK